MNFGSHKSVNTLLLSILLLTTLCYRSMIYQLKIKSIAIFVQVQISRDVFFPNLHLSAKKEEKQKHLCVLDGMIYIQQTSKCQSDITSAPILEGALHIFLRTDFQLN